MHISPIGCGGWNGMAWNWLHLPEISYFRPLPGDFLSQNLCSPRQPFLRSFRYHCSLRFLHLHHHRRHHHLQLLLLFEKKKHENVTNFIAKYSLLKNSSLQIKEKSDKCLVRFHPKCLHLISKIELNCHVQQVGRVFNIILIAKKKLSKNSTQKKRHRLTIIIWIEFHGFDFSFRCRAPTIRFLQLQKWTHYYVFSV